VFSLLAVLIAFVGTMLVLALAAQSIQELLKVAFAIKGRARLEALRGLIIEAARTVCQSEAAGRAIFDSVVDRLRALGQSGVRSSAVRLDGVTPTELAGLILKTDTARTAELSGLGEAERLKRLETIAAQTKEWFGLAMAPVDERYRRRMRVWALLSSSIVVLGLNADALTIFDQARTDPAFQARMEMVARSLDSLRGEEKRIEGHLASAAAPVESSAAGAPSTTGAAAWQDSLNAISARKRSLADSAAWSGTFLTGEVGSWRWTDPAWWTGILLSILLVSLGAPFWHDLLEALFGLKNRVRAQATSENSKRDEDNKGP
jgi:hypothetical protein